MKPTRWIGLALLAWGGAGVLNQFFMIQALQSGQAPTAALNAVDPAAMLGIASTAGASWTSPPMLGDAAIAAAGAYLFWGM